jgi:hypothetical protein
MLRVRGLIHPTSAVCATTDTARGEKRLPSEQNQAILKSSGRPLGECRVKALASTGVQIVMGQFKEKERSCLKCKTTWTQHEEKETDVNIALFVLNEAYRNTYDRAYIVSRDSDLKPAVEMVRARFPEKEMYIVAPPHLGHSNDLIQVAHGKRKIKKPQIERCLFPDQITDGQGNVIAVRPKEYAPPANP